MHVVLFGVCIVQRSIFYKNILLIVLFFICSFYISCEMPPRMQATPRAQAQEWTHACLKYFEVFVTCFFLGGGRRSDNRYQTFG
jgi:hypothetical protein